MFKKIKSTQETHVGDRHSSKSLHSKRSKRHSRPVKTEQGIASFYVAIFATLIFGIITLSFVRIMLSEAEQTSNNDLSRSAYDSALAGIEDGKIAVLKYQECLSRGTPHATEADLKNWYSGGGSECNRIVHNMEKGIKDQSCDTVAKTLLRPTSNGDNTGEVLVQESRGASAASQGLEQAYTCVKISEDLPDYLSTLNSTNRTRVIPLRTENSTTFNRIRLQWYSQANHVAQSKSSGAQYSYNNNQTSFGPNAIAPPPMAISFVQTDQSFTLNELSVSSANGTDVGRLTLRPSSGTGNSVYSIDAKAIPAELIINSANKSANNVTKVKCEKKSAGFTFACSVDIDLPNTFRGDLTIKRNISSAFLVISLLYGEPITDISVELCNSSCNGSSSSGSSGVTNFSGAQTSIDSTGRANDLYRRVETRLELYDIGFPYPEYAIQGDGDNSSITKDFYSTKNCWYSNSKPLSGNGNTGGTCNNNNAKF